MTLLAAASLEGEPWLVHGFSTRAGGVTRVYGREDDLNLGFTKEDERERVLVNRQRLLGATGMGRLALVRQVHSAVIARVAAAGVAEGAEADGLITSEPDVLLGIQTADCVPVLVADPVRRAIGAFHAGWRGTRQRIVEQGISQMAKEFGSKPADLRAAVGPAIGKCCYTVGDEVRASFREAFRYADALFDGSTLDLKQANLRQLLDAGVPASQVSVTGGCTRCEPDSYFSYRAQQGKTGRMLSVIGIRR